MKVFVYGTLKRGFTNHYVMEMSEGKFLKQASTEPKYSLFDLGAFPGVMKGGSTRVKGEVYEVSDLQDLDWLEGYPDLYDRSEITLDSGDVAWMYTINDLHGFNYSLVEHGEWL